MVIQMSRLIRVVLFACGVVAMNSVPALAGSIGPSCGSCQGSIYTLENLGLASADLYTADGSFDTWRIALTIDTDDYTGTGVRIDEVAIKVSSSANQAVLVDAPGGAGVWKVVPGGLNANGCSGSGSGFECSDWLVGSLGGATIPGGPFTWVFDIDVSSALLTGTNGASIKARYVDQYGNKVGALVSENITLGPPVTVPEPGTLALLGVGVAAMVARRRRVEA
jgi:hypothetical protein